MASRKQQKTDRKARIEQMRQRERARQRKMRVIWAGGGTIVAAGIAAAIAVPALSSTSSPVASSSEVMPTGVTGQSVTEPAASTVANPTGISGVVAYDTTGWPTTSHNGPASTALRHNHVNGPVKYSVTPPVGGDHNANWMNCGVYDKPVPSERAVHNLEHGAVWITYQPSLPKSEVSQLYSFFGRQSSINPSGQGSSRYLDITPYPGLSSPIVASSWGFQLKLSSPTDPRLQQFVDKLRVSKTYTPEYGAPCTGGIGTPLKQ